MPADNFLQNAANFATGGLYNQLSGRGQELARERMDQMSAMLADPEALQSAAQYNPGFLERVANLLSGGIYGQATGMNEKMAAAQMAKKSIMEEELRRRMLERMRRYNQGVEPEPVGSELNPVRGVAPMNSSNTFAGGY